MKTIAYSFATKKDVMTIKNLLKESKLPYVDIDSHISHFIVAKRTGYVVGNIGIEPLGKYGLLRSLVVNTFVRGNGIATELNKKIVEHAISLDINELYLLTEGAAGYFKKFGFKEINRNYVPNEILKTREFTQLCPSTAICMHKKIKVF